MPVHTIKCAEKGYVLLVVILFFLLFSMLALESLNNITNQRRLLRLNFQTQVKLLIAEKVMNQLQESNLSNLTCIIQRNLTNEIKLKNIEWWKQFGCANFENDNKYYYILEDLAVNPCAMIDSKNKAHFYRITLFLQAHNGLLLQSTFTKQAQESIRCNEQTYHVKLGRQSLIQL